MNEDAADWLGLGADLKRYRDARRWTRSVVEAAGGPSAGTIQRIEAGGGKGMKPATKEDLERALGLAPGSIDRRLAGGELISGDAPQRVEVIEGNGERVLMLIMGGVTELPEADRHIILTLVRELQERDSHG
jgi:hypothetical protein